MSSATQTSDYVHDLAGRLGTVTVDGALIADYAYDSNSNRVGVMQAGAGIPTSGCAAGLSSVSASVDAQDRLLTYGTCQYQYTDNGELNHKTDSASSAQTSYQYDSFSNLRHVSLPDGRNIDYAIDGRNRRIGKSINGVIVQGLIYLNDLEPVAETDASGNRIATFVYADRANTPSYLLKGGNVYRVIADHLGSVRLVVNVTDGTIAQRLDYDAWGQVLLDTNPGFQPFGFAGGIYDRDTGLVRFGARDYDPETGRWTNKDPLDFGGGDSNIFQYVFSDPINTTDVTGLDPTGIVIHAPTFFSLTTFEANRRDTNLNDAVNQGKLFRTVTGPAIIGAGSVNALALGSTTFPIIGEGIEVGANSCRAIAQSEPARKAALATCLAVGLCQGTPARGFAADRDRAQQLVTGLANEARRLYKIIFPL